MKALGDHYEDQAASYLEAQGLEIIDRNYRERWGEIDLVAWDQETLVFVEVKGRKSAAFGWPREYVDGRKRAKIRQTAQAYLVRYQLTQVPVRFDVVEILGQPGQVTHLKNAF